MKERDVFLAVLDLPDAAARARYLDEVCGDDNSLRAKVEALLRSHESAGSFLQAPAVAPCSDSAASQGLSATLGGVSGGRRAAVEGSDEESLTFLAPPGRHDSLGRIGHYEVLQILGRGGFGIVFRAFDDVLQRVVAVKVMAPQLAVTSPARKRFLREARSSAQVRHENVVQVYAVEEEPLPYLVMEFMPGETLQRRLDRVGPLDVLEVLRIGRQIAEGLAAAHATGLIHRDIKPANVLLDDGPHMRVKITDFGLARAADDASMTQSGTIAGTPMYMAPEQARGHTLDQRADLFSFGTVLYQIVAGRAPFRANSTLAVLKRVAEDMPRPIREIIPETPQWLCDIISKLHAKNPDDRFQSAREVANLLADCEAKLKAQQEVKNPFPVRRTASAGWKKWGTAAALLLVVAGISVATYKIAPVAPWVRNPRGTITDKKRDFAVLSLRLNSTAIAYRIDGDGPHQTGVSVVQIPLEPGEHKVWFALGDRQFQTAPFVVAAGQSAELSLEVTPTIGTALMDGQPLRVTPVPGKAPGPLWPAVPGGSS